MDGSQNCEIDMASKVDADERDVLREAYADVVPLSDRERVAPPGPPPCSSPLYDEDVEVLRELAELVDGDALFDAFPHSEEHRQWAAEGTQAGLVDRLASGEFPYQAHIDLHGRTRSEARRELIGFMSESRKRSHRCILVVHGRGNRSKNGEAVLRNSLHKWLSRGVLDRGVMAFSTALGVDGGGGATSVLLTES